MTTGPDGVPLRAIAETPGFDPVRTWGPGPLLLIKAPTPNSAAPYHFTTPPDGSRTSLHSTNTLGRLGGGGSAFLAPLAVLVPIRKSTRNVWSQQVTIGRARNNDIRLSDPSVSKVHAYIFLPPAWPMTTEGGWRLVDASSTNGTRVQTAGGWIPAPGTGEGGGLHLSTGQEIQLGSVEAIYLDPEDLTHLLDYARTEWNREDLKAAKRGSPATDKLPKPPLPDPTSGPQGSGRGEVLGDSGDSSQE